MSEFAILTHLSGSDPYQILTGVISPIVGHIIYNKNLGLMTQMIVFRPSNPVLGQKSTKLFSKA